MSCIHLRNGLDTSCGTYQKKYHQQIVLINKDDVLDYLIISNTDGDCRHRILFTLKEGKSGFRFNSIGGGVSNFGRFEKSVKDGVPQYLHVLQLLVMGVTEDIKCLLKDLDNAEYFGAIQYTDGTVEIYGWDYGLKTADYAFDPQAGGGGSVILLTSDDDAQEDDPPFIYVSNPEGKENDDFDNNFGDNSPLPEGDFNFDFNDDFYIGE